MVQYDLLWFQTAKINEFYCKSHLYYIATKNYMHTNLFAVEKKRILETI